MRDHLMDDDPFDANDLAFDDQLRHLLASEEHRTDDPGVVLDALRPRIARARLVRRTSLAAAVVAPLTLLVFAALLLPDATRPSVRQATVAGEPPSTADGDPEDLDALSVTGTTAATADVGTDTDSGGQTENDDSEPVPVPPDSTDATDSPSSGSSVPPQSTTATTATSPSSDPSEPPPTTAPPRTTDGPSTTSSIPGSVEGETVCGSILVLPDGGGLELLGTDPEPGYEVDIKSYGPEIEVSFEGSDGHCEIRAEFERGRVVFDRSEE